MGGSIYKGGLFNSVPLPEPRRQSLLGDVSSGPGTPPTPLPLGTSLLGALAEPRKPTFADILGLDDRYRRRSEWEERFTHWERSESDAESQRIERARDMVQRVLRANAWLTPEGARIVPQGSFTNRTNTRLDADIDLRVQHPALKLEYGPLVIGQYAYSAGGYFEVGRKFAQIANDMRVNITTELRHAFGWNAVHPGNKSIRVNGLDGSRAEVDVVPAFTLHYITWDQTLGRYNTYVGVAILALDGTWTLNYPDQHQANGRAKRQNTGLQFKKVVRIIKRMRADMADRKLLDFKVPSFLVECLVYNVPHYVFVLNNNRYDRVKAVLREIAAILDNDSRTRAAVEVNGIKSLFGPGQTWNLQDAQKFIRLALVHLGDD